MSSSNLTTILDAQQRQAVDPNYSVWLAASAGTGKTRVLINRILALLLSGTDPDRILCVTYTNAAAAEMVTRLQDALAEWVNCREEDLRSSIEILLGRNYVNARTIQRARALFAMVLDIPGGIRIRTIHGFCQMVLRLFPLESGLSPHFELLEGETARNLLRQIKSSLVHTASAQVQNAYQHLLRYKNEQDVEELFADIIDRSDDLHRFFATHNYDLLKIADALAQSLKYDSAWLQSEEKDNLTNEDLDSTRAISTEKERILCQFFCEETDFFQQLEELLPVWQASSKSGAARAERVKTIWKKNIHDRVAGWELYQAIFLTQKQEIFKQLTVKKMQQEAPELAELVEKEAERVLRCKQRLAQIELFYHSLAMLNCALWLLENYQVIKRQKGMLDYDDLINHTANLLQSEGVAPWILYKLDGGIDHILIDEAQDTNPASWQIIASLLEEFHSGKTRSTNIGQERTLFVVGDEKQSIYSFQGADAQSFGRTKMRLRSKFQQAKQNFQIVAMEKSYRSSPAILDFVDQLFSYPEHVQGLLSEENLMQRDLRHIAAKTDLPGMVELWPVFETEDAAPEEDAETDPPSAEEVIQGWDFPYQRPEKKSGYALYAQKIVQNIKYWLDSDEPMPGLGRKLQPGDVLILLRRRQILFAECIAALKKHNIPMTGVDRLVLQQSLAVRDILNWAQWSLCPEDDLALAKLLKSPFIGWEEDQLCHIAAGRKTSLWQTLRQMDTDRQTAPIVSWLYGWQRSLTHYLPYEALVKLLAEPCPGDILSGKRALLKRLGEESHDALTELLNIALDFQHRHIPSWQSFVAHCQEQESAVKRDPEQAGNRLRIMTVHGAKGLQAPVVILPDTGDIQSVTRNMGKRLLWPRGVSTPPLWQPKKDLSAQGVPTYLNRIREQEYAEHRRLLYVALTRAEQVLYISCYQSARQKNGKAESWYKMCQMTMSDICDESFEIGFGEAQRSLYQGKMQSQYGQSSLVKAQTLPDFFLHKPKDIPVAHPRQYPSRWDEEIIGARPVQQKKVAHSAEFRPSLPPVLHGRLSHYLLQILPGRPRSEWSRALPVILENFGVSPKTEYCKYYLGMTKKIVEHPELHPLFGSDALSEVPVLGQLRRPGDKKRIEFSGQIDRLFWHKKSCIFVDFKTGAVPYTQQDIPPIYLRQMAIYQALLRQMDTDIAVKSALVWVEEPRIFWLDCQVLEGYMETI